ncbi:MAG: LLM class flavin-dependent oxidoreductase [Candidatus Thorarchaeota archaeon]
MQWGLGVNVMQSVDETIKTSIIADKGGIDKLWVIDFPSQRHAFAVSARIANETKARIGIGLISPLLYRPNQIVQAIETLVKNFGERFELLIGVGDRQQLGKIGVEYGKVGTLVSRVVDSVREINAHLSEKGIICPIWLGAQGPKMIKASLETDGILLNYTEPSMIKWALQILGKRPKDFGIGVFPPVSIVNNSRIGPSNDFKFAAAIVALGISPTISKQFNLDSIISSPKLSVKRKGKLTQSIVDSLDDSLLSRFGFHGTSECVYEYIQGLTTIGVDNIVFGPPLNRMLEGIKSLLKKRAYNADAI